MRRHSPSTLLKSVILASLWLLCVLLSACHTTPEAQAIPVAPITGSGSIEGRSVIIASELGGRIVALGSAEGDAVRAGDVLVQFDPADAQATVMQASAAVAMAKANLLQLEEGARPEALAAAEAALDAAYAEAFGAERALLAAREAISQPIEIDLEIAQARLQAALAAQRVEQARAELEAERLNYHIYVDLKSDVSQETRRIWDMRLVAAEARIKQAQADLDVANADVRALYQLRAVPLQALAELHVAESTYTATLAAVARAQADLDGLRAGSRPPEIAIAQAQLAQAEAALELALTQQSMLTLTAPISGVLASRSYHVGEVVPAGVPILTLIDLDPVYLNVYVPETRISEVRLGAAVDIRLDSYPGERFEGVVERVSAQAEYTPSSVETAGDRARRVFAVRVRIPNPNGRFLPGMPAHASLLP